MWRLQSWEMTQASMDARKWFYPNKGQEQRRLSLPQSFLFSGYCEISTQEEGFPFFWSSLRYSEGETPLCFLKRRLKYRALS